MITAITMMAMWRENTTTVDKILIKIEFVLPPLSSINCGKIPLYYVTVREQIVAGNMKLGSWRNPKI